MIEQKEQNNQLPNELHTIFKELEILKHLRNTNIKKNFGFTCSYLFQLVFCLIFHHRLQKEFQGRSYDLLISHTTIVFSRYIVLSWQNRCNTDNRTLGGFFYELCDEIQDLDWAVALQQLVELL
jgi:hypothetical protein